MSKPISQREARRLRKRVQELEGMIAQQQSGWARDFPGGTNFWTIQRLSEASVAAIGTARRLGHAVVVVNVNDELRCFSLPVKAP